MPTSRTALPGPDARLLEHLFRQGPSAPADLARDLGTTRATIDGLVRRGLVLAPSDDGKSGRTGRPGGGLRLNPRHATLLGADIGIGRITAVALDFCGQVIGRSVRLYDPARAAPAAVVEAAATLVESLLLDLPDAGPVRGLNVAAAGLIDADFNVMRVPILRWSNLPLTAVLRTRLPALETIVAENDANAFALAETYRAGPAAPQDALYVLLDVGVGAGIVAGGQLLRGHDGYAGEIGHLPVGERGFSPSTTLPGSLESFVGRDAVLARDLFHGGTSLSLGEFLTALEAGTPSATATLADWAHYLGRGLAVLTPLFNPERIVLGGSVAALFAHGGHAVLTAMRTYMLASQPMPDVVLSRLGPDAPAIGAAYRLHRRLLAEPQRVAAGAPLEPADAL